jgi:hypothetical protein
MGGQVRSRLAPLPMIVRHKPLSADLVPINLSELLRQIETTAQLLVTVLDEAVKAHRDGWQIVEPRIFRKEVGEVDEVAAVRRANRRRPGDAHRGRLLPDHAREHAVRVSHPGLSFAPHDARPSACCTSNAPAPSSATGRRRHDRDPTAGRGESDQQPRRPRTHTPRHGHTEPLFQNPEEFVDGARCHGGRRRPEERPQRASRFPLEAWTLFKNTEIRRYTRDVVEPLAREGVEMVTFTSVGNDPVEVLKDDLAAFTVIDLEEQRIGDSEVEMHVEIVAPTFNRTNKWRVSTGDHVFWAAVRDEGFLERVDSGDEAFRKGDMLRCRMEVAQSRDVEGLHTEYTIIHVLDHIPRPTQMTLGDDGV